MGGMGGGQGAQPGGGGGQPGGGGGGPQRTGQQSNSPETETGSNPTGGLADFNDWSGGPWYEPDILPWAPWQSETPPDVKANWVPDQYTGWDPNLDSFGMFGGGGPGFGTLPPGGDPQGNQSSAQRLGSESHGTAHGGNPAWGGPTTGPTVPGTTHSAPWYEPDVLPWAPPNSLTPPDVEANEINSNYTDWYGDDVYGMFEGGGGPPGMFDQGQQQQQQQQQSRSQGTGLVPPGGQGGQQPNVQPPVSIYDTYDAGYDLMQETLDKDIGAAVSSAGFGGNRYGTAAANAVGGVGADATAALNSSFQNMLYNQGQSDLDRQLQAAGMGMQNEQFLMGLQAQNQNQGLDRLLRGADVGREQFQAEEAATLARIQNLFGMGQAETNRVDQFDMAGLNAYQQDKWAPLQNMAPFVTGSPMQPGQPIVSQTGGREGVGAYLMPIITAMAAGGMFTSDENLKHNIEGTGTYVAPGLEVKSFNWNDDGSPSLGLIAQDVEQVIPEAVFDTPQGYKVINAASLINGLVF